MASKTRPSSLNNEIKEVVAYRLDDVASSSCDDEKTTDDQGSLTEESWSNPPINKYRLCSCFVLFLGGGLLFSSYGVLIPQYEKDRHLSHTAVSLIFIGDIVSSIIAVFTVNLTHLSLGRRGAGAIAALFLGLGNLFLTLHPPWPVVPIMMCVAAYGVAALESAACSWVGGLRHASGLLGLLQACFGIGCTISPLIANGMIQHGIPYYRFYYVPAALATLGGIGFIISFWDEDGKKYAQDTSRSHQPGVSHTKEILKSKISWILALLVMINWGIEATIGSWIVVYLNTRWKHSSDSGHSSLVNSMFWFSFTFGRLALTWVIGALPSKWQGKGPMSFFILLSIILELMVWLLPTFVGSSVAVCLLGFFSGPWYPMVIRMLTKLLPPHLHVTAIGVGSAFGAAGNSFFPIAAGAIAGSRGVSMIHPLILGAYIAGWILWHCIPVSPQQPMTK